MAQEIGRISRPAAEQYQGRRKLLLVPLVYGPPDDAQDGVAILQEYWDQMQTQVKSLESALGGLRRLYHESIPAGGQEGLDYLERVDQRSHRFVEAKCESGATLEATEDAGLLAEIMDLQRCLMMPLISGKVAQKLQEWFTESNRGRYEHISKQIDSTLGEGEAGLLLVSERHQIQFPADIEVFYVSPPALDEFRRWLQDWIARQQSLPEAPPETPTEEAPEETPEEQ
tara:strand:+ start:2171 stop:2854 length:684 start_codon:yes stop_codon:yes gene_type:complete